MKIKVSWHIPAEEGVFEICPEDLRLSSEEWTKLVPSEQADVLKNYMDERDFFNWAILDEYEVVDG